MFFGFWVVAAGGFGKDWACADKEIATKMHKNRKSVFVAILFPFIFREQLLNHFLSVFITLGAGVA